MELVIFSLYIISCASLAALIASTKGRDVLAFSVVGGLLGLIGVLIAACVADKSETPS